MGVCVIMVLSAVSLPSAIYMLAHPEAGFVPPSFIVLPVCMFGVGVNMLFPGLQWRRRLRWASLLLLPIGSIMTISLWYIGIPKRMIGHRGFLGYDSGQYPPQNFLVLVFLVLLFLYTSPSEKVRRISSPLVWFGFIFSMLYFLLFVHSWIGSDIAKVVYAHI